MFCFRILVNFFIIVSLFYFSESYSQPCRVLHYTETSGFDHQTRSASFAMFQQIGTQSGFLVDNDSTGQSFNSLANLQQYNAVIFSNTSGDNILDAVQKTNFEQYMNGGGCFIGIHSASDTYRHSTANGTNTGAWDWYAEMLGASVRQNPNHVNGTPVYRIDALISHPLLADIPNPWHKAEEYYYWESGYFDSTNNIVLQKVEQTIGPNSIVNSYDSARGVTWCKILPGVGRSFYTSLGHAVSNYTSDTSFYRLLSNAVLWACDSTADIRDFAVNEMIAFYPNPALSELRISSSEFGDKNELTIFNMLGEQVFPSPLSSPLLKERGAGGEVINISALPSGVYFLRITDVKNSRRAKFVKAQ